MWEAVQLVRPEFPAAAIGALFRGPLPPGSNGLVLAAAEVFRRTVHLSRPVSVTEGEEEDLAAALISEASRELERLYPGIRFHVFTWDGTTAGVVRRLTENGLRVHTIRQIIPDYTDAYLIAPPFEYHPTAAAYERVAAYFLGLER